MVEFSASAVGDEKEPSRCSPVAVSTPEPIAVQFWVMHVPRLRAQSPVRVCRRQLINRLMFPSHKYF